MVRLPAMATASTEIQQPITKASGEMPEVAPEGGPKHMPTNAPPPDAQALPPETTISKQGHVKRPV